VLYDFTQGHVKCGNSGPEIFRVFIAWHSGTLNAFVLRLGESGRSPESGAFHPEPEPEVREEPGLHADTRQVRAVKQKSDHEDNSAAAHSPEWRPGGIAEDQTDRITG
jgi:hypothetical protein